MGLFKNVRDLQKLGKEASKNHDPAAQMRAAKAQMEQMTQQANLVSSPTAVTAPASVGAVRDTGMLVDHQPVVEVDVTVMPAGGAPFPATVRVQGVAALMSLSTGSTVTVRYEPSNPATVGLA